MAVFDRIFGIQCVVYSLTILLNFNPILRNRSLFFHTVDGALLFEGLNEVFAGGVFDLENLSSLVNT